MTGAAVVWLLGRKNKAREPRPHDTPADVVQPTADFKAAERAVQESAARARKVSSQRGAIVRVVSSLVEIRKENHFGDNIRAAMGGDE